MGQPAYVPGAGHLREFRLEWGLPVWTYEVGGFRLEKRVFLGHLQNTVHVIYRLILGDGGLRLELHPTVHFRPHDAPVSTPLGGPYTLIAVEHRYELCSPWPNLPSLRLSLQGTNPTFTVAPRKIEDVYYDVEARRGYESVGDLWCPGFFGIDLEAGEDAASLVASTETWEVVKALRSTEAFSAEMERRRRLIYNADPRAHQGPAAELVLAADQFVITPPAASEDAARAHAAGDEVRTRHRRLPLVHRLGPRHDDQPRRADARRPAGSVEAGYILRTFAHYVRDGLIPNLFPEGDKRGALPHGRRHALVLPRPRPLPARPPATARRCGSCCRSCSTSSTITCAGRASASASIPQDGLLAAGSGGVSAHLDGRQGRRLGGDAAAGQGGRDQRPLVQRPAPARRLGARGRDDDATARRASAEHAERRRESFNRRFWYAEGGYLYDVVDGETTGDDPACRPNQVFAISLEHPVLDRGALGAGAGRGRPSGCSRRSACARWRRAIPTTSRPTTATCGPATPPTTRGRSGPG